MKDFDLVHFYASEETFEKAAKIFESEKARLQELIPEADIQHVGSCSIPGAIGKFDIDIQIRVPRELFEQTKEIMQQNYQEKHKEKLWDENGIIFKSPEGAPYDIDYVVTVIGGRKDDYYRLRDYFINNPDALAAYNAFKMKFEGKPYHEYRSAKWEFLGLPGSVKFLDY